jgi:NAD(P)-dependent dehydrogenase (short-subunit alcohol dehydrogenase family)
MSGRLHDKVALVSGIGAGIGRAVGIRFAREGALVLGCDIDEERAQELASWARAEGLSIGAVGGIDVTQPSDVKRFVAQAVETHQRIDIVVNAAARARFAPIESMSFENEWLPTLHSEVSSVFLISQAAWPHLMRSGGGSIINFSSVAAARGHEGIGMVAHAAGKGAVFSMTKQLAVEGGPHAIRCNSISPGFTRTAATTQHGDSPLTRQFIQKKILKRIGEPDDIAWCALYLAADESAWVTGADFQVDGGMRSV